MINGINYWRFEYWIPEENLVVAVWYAVKGVSLDPVTMKNTIHYNANPLIVERKPAGKVLFQFTKIDSVGDGSVTVRLRNKDGLWEEVR